MRIPLSMYWAASVLVVAAALHCAFAFHPSHQPVSHCALHHTLYVAVMSESTRLGASNNGSGKGDDGPTPTKQVPTSCVTTVKSSPVSAAWSRRRLFTNAATAAGIASAVWLDPTSSTSSGLPTFRTSPPPANAVGPTKITLLNPTYSAVPCPRDRPIPGEKAMKGMKGLCVTVNVDLEESPDKPLEKVGVYGFVTDHATGESVLANNPDLSTDAGQFAMVEIVNPSDKKIQFEFIAAVPRETDVSQFENGIGPLDFGSLRVISYPGGQQFGAINPCEMNEFSDECDAWEQENGPYTKGEYMVKSNPRTKGY